jgi:hypothetical protein
MAKYKLLRDYTELTNSDWLSVVKYYETHTARETAIEFGLIFNQTLVTALAREHPKNAGHGGARNGAGNRNEENRRASELKKAINACLHDGRHSVACAGKRC